MVLKCYCWEHRLWQTVYNQVQKSHVIPSFQENHHSWHKATKGIQQSATRGITDCCVWRMPNTSQTYLDSASAGCPLLWSMTCICGTSGAYMWTSAPPRLRCTRTLQKWTKNVQKTFMGEALSGPQVLLQIFHHLTLKDEEKHISYQRRPPGTTKASFPQVPRCHGSIPHSH